MGAKVSSVSDSFLDAFCRSGLGGLERPKGFSLAHDWSSDYYGQFPASGSRSPGGYEPALLETSPRWSDSECRNLLLSSKTVFRSEVFAFAGSLQRDCDDHGRKISIHTGRNGETMVARSKTTDRFLVAPIAWGPRHNRRPLDAGMPFHTRGHCERVSNTEGPT